MWRHVRSTLAAWSHVRHFSILIVHEYAREHSLAWVIACIRAASLCGVTYFIQSTWFSGLASAIYSSAAASIASRESRSKGIIFSCLRFILFFHLFDLWRWIVYSSDTRFQSICAWKQSDTSEFARMNMFIYACIHLHFRKFIRSRSRVILVSFREPLHPCV